VLLAVLRKRAPPRPRSRSPTRRSLEAIAERVADTCAARGQALIRSSLPLPEPPTVALSLAATVLGTIYPAAPRIRPLSAGSEGSVRLPLRARRLLSLPRDSPALIRVAAYVSIYLPAAYEYTATGIGAAFVGRHPLDGAHSCKRVADNGVATRAGIELLVGEVIVEDR